MEDGDASFVRRDSRSGGASYGFMSLDWTYLGELSAQHLIGNPTARIS